MKSRLLALRGRIDRIDARLLELLQRRAALVSLAFRAKRAAGAPLFDAGRTSRLLRRIVARSVGPLTRDEVTRLVRPILAFFALEYEEAAPVERRAVAIARAHLALPWVVVAPPRGATASARRRVARLVRRLGGRFLATADRALCAREGLLRVGRDAAADLVEAGVTEWARLRRLARGRRAVLLAAEGPACGPDLLEAAAILERGGCRAIALSFPGGEAAAWRRLRARTDYPVLVVVAGGAKAAGAALRGGADGVILEVDPESPGGLDALLRRAAGRRE
ncbi:MAG: chorismate mutase [Planctomycetaceae bacterium]